MLNIYQENFIVISAEIVNLNLTICILKMIKLIFRCFACKMNYQKDFDKDLMNRFANTYRFCNEDISNFIFLLRKGVYPYEYMDSWERFNETSLPDKKAFYSELNLEDITDKD